jgi:predicted ATP-grasp superfamily ATP-dependent carboligase
MNTEPDQLPIFIITSSNWTMEVPLNEYNVQFDVEAQVMECATAAMEVFYNIKDTHKLVMNADSKGDEPFLGATLLAHPKGFDPENAAVVFTHVCLANMGLYKESVKMQEILEEQIKKLREKQEKEKKEKAKQHKKSLETFDVLKKELDSKKKLTKKAKKTSNEDDLSKN